MTHETQCDKGATTAMDRRDTATATGPRDRRLAQELALPQILRMRRAQCLHKHFMVSKATARPPALPGKLQRVRLLLGFNGVQAAGTVHRRLMLSTNKHAQLYTVQCECDARQHGR
jgi:hypothetical protein